MTDVGTTLARHNRWHLSGTVGSTTLSIYLEVAAAYEWQRPEPARKAVDPNGGSPTMIYRSDGTLPKRAGRPPFRIPNKGNMAATITALETAYSLRGPWALATPTETFNVVVDPTQGAWSVQNAGWFRTVTFGLVEV